jgi:aspartyl-tRNA(Asn)/glutamyl-tRNA(Gln) amidotransferase subunit A
MHADDLCFLPAFELAARIRQRDVSPVEVTRAVLERADRLDPHLNAFCTRMDEEALAEAQRAEVAVARGDVLGPLHGVPVSIKDNIYIKGCRTTFGSKLLENDVTAVDAPLVERLRAAGAILIGRTNSPEFGWKGVTDNRVFGITRNPWNLELTPGGSSGGASAAVASGIGPIGIGTDGGGSLRIPASFCGLVGHKPSYGRVPTWPGVSIGALRHPGGITRTVTDSALLLNVISGPDERDAGSLPADDVDYVAELDRGIDGVRIAFSPNLGYSTVHHDVAKHVALGAEAFSETGASIERVDLDWPDPYECWKVFFYGAAAARLGRELDQRGDLLDPGLRLAVEEAVQLTGLESSAALVARDEFWQRVRVLFESFDLLITPTLAVPPFPVGQDNAPPLTDEPQGELQWTQFTYPFNLTGQPAVSLPCGWTDEGLPIGMQIIGRRFDDALVLRAARAFEIARPWHDRRPTLPES